MPQVSPLVLEFARDQLRNLVRDLLDDPSDLIHPEREHEPGEEIAGYRQLSVDLALDFDDLVGHGSEYERRRLSALEKLLTKDDTRRYLRELDRTPSGIALDSFRPTALSEPRKGWPYKALAIKPAGTLPHR